MSRRTAFCERKREAAIKRAPVLSGPRGLQHSGRQDPHLGRVAAVEPVKNDDEDRDEHGRGNRPHRAPN